jgi:hypothetical protein
MREMTLLKPARKASRRGVYASPLELFLPPIR